MSRNRLIAAFTNGLPVANSLLPFGPTSSTTILPKYWYGEAVQKSIPTGLHGMVQFWIMTLLNQAGWRTASAVRLKVQSNAEPVPDVIAVLGKMTRRYPTVAPDLYIEILSPDDKLPKALEKAATYLSWGTRQVRVIDPAEQTAWSFESGEPIFIPRSGTLQIDDTSIELTQLFNLVDAELDSGD